MTVSASDPQLGNIDIRTLHASAFPRKTHGAFMIAAAFETFFALSVFVNGLAFLHFGT
jgi:hypothetical protein